MHIQPDTPYHEALAALALEIGLDPGDLAEREELVIDAVAVGFSARRHAGAQGIEMVCKVGPLPQPPSLSLLRLLLQANTLGFVTAGATLGLQHNADALVLASLHPLNMPPVALARACRTLAETAAVWLLAIDQGLDQTDTAATDHRIFRG